MAMVEAGGLEALSINKLAEAVDYTPGALYRYFDSKDALLAQLVGRVLDELRGHLLDALARLPATARPLDRVLALIFEFCRFAERAPHRFGLLAVTLADPRVLLTDATQVEPVSRAMMAALAPMRDALDDAAGCGQLGRGELAERTICMFALLHGLLQLRKRADRAPALLDIKHLAARGSRALLLGWGASSATLDRSIARAAELSTLPRRRRRS